MIGDALETALTKLGITDDRVSKWLGRPCGCKDRKQRLNSLHAWATRVMHGKVTGAIGFLDRILEPDMPLHSRGYTDNVNQNNSRRD